METIILITVLATLGVVALVTTIVIVFMKLNKKVDVNQFVKVYEEIHQTMRGSEFTAHENNGKTASKIEAISDELFRTIDKLESKLDSRADKLHDLIKLTEKELVNHFDSRVSELEDVNSKLTFNNKELLKG